MISYYLVENLPGSEVINLLISLWSCNNAKVKDEHCCRHRRRYTSTLVQSRFLLDGSLFMVRWSLRWMRIYFHSSLAPEQAFPANLQGIIQSNPIQWPLQICAQTLYVCTIPSPAGTLVSHQQTCARPILLKICRGPMRMDASKQSRQLG